jgi:hypothetical protein
MSVHVVDIESAQLSDPDPRRVEELENGEVSHGHWVIVGLGAIRCGRHELGDLTVCKHMRQRPMCLGSSQSDTDIAVRTSSSRRPLGESAGGGGSAREGAAGTPGGLLQR